MKLNFSLLLAASLLLGISTAATAASSSSKSSSSKASTASSKSSSSRSSSVSSCASSAGNVFIDCVDPAWKDLSAYEQRKDYQVQGEVLESKKGQMTRWRIATDSAPNHKKVIEVTYLDNNNYNSLVHFYSKTDTIDMSAYATGKLMFDIKLLDKGKLSPSLQVLLDCGYPCQSHEFVLPKLTPNTWKTVEVPVAKLVDGGLDLTLVNMGFQILPEWNKQNGVMFQLDNIRWVKGTGAAPAPVAHCYEERFETWGLPFSTTSFAGSPKTINGMVRQIIAFTNLTPNWTTANDKIGYAPSVDSSFPACALTDGSISAQVYLEKAYVRNNKMQLGFYYQDASGRRAWFPPMATTGLTADDWTTVSTQLVTADHQPAFSGTDAGFDLSNVTQVGLYFDAKGKKPAAGGLIRLDNIFITGQPILSSSSSSSSSSSNSSSSVADCSGSQLFSGNNALGIGIPAGDQLYVSLSLTDASFTGATPELSSANGSITVQYANDQRAVYLLQAPTGMDASELLQTTFGYSISGANAALNIGIYSTATEAINSVNALNVSALALNSCSASSSSSSSVASSSASSVVSSSSSSSSSSSTATCSLKNFTSNIPLGSGVAASNQAYVALKLNNATFNGDPAISNSATSNTILWNTTNRTIFTLVANSSISQSELLGVSFSYTVTNANSAVTLEYSLYDTPVSAINEQSASRLATSSYNLNNACH